MCMNTSGPACSVGAAASSLRPLCRGWVLCAVGTRCVANDGLALRWKWFADRPRICAAPIGQCGRLQTDDLDDHLADPHRTQAADARPLSAAAVALPRSVAADEAVHDLLCSVRGCAQSSLLSLPNPRRGARFPRMRSWPRTPLSWTWTRTASERRPGQHATGRGRGRGQSTRTPASVTSRRRRPSSTGRGDMERRPRKFESSASRPCPTCSETCQRHHAHGQPNVAAAPPACMPTTVTIANAIDLPAPGIRSRLQTPWTADAGLVGLKGAPPREAVAGRP
jgi:hypothetical protein